MNHSFEDLHKLSNLRGSLSDLYTNIALKVFGFSLISVFLPIYMISDGWHFGRIVMFFGVFFLSGAFFALVSPAFAKSAGLKNSILVSFIALLGFFVALYNSMAWNGVCFYLAAVLGGLSEALYFTAINIDFALNSGRAHRAENISALDSFFKSSALFAPVVGAWIIVSYGFDLLFGIVMLLIVLGMFGAFELKGMKEKFRFSVYGVFRREFLRDGVIFFAYGLLSAAEWFLWPVVVFLLTGNVYVVALAVAFEAFGSAVFAGLFKKVALGYELASFVRVGALIYALSWLLRMYASSLAEIYALSFLSGLVVVLVNVPLFTETVERARERGVAEFVAFREFMVCLGRVGLFVLFYLGLSYGVPWVILGFLAAALLSLVFLGF